MSTLEECLGVLSSKSNMQQCADYFLALPEDIQKEFAHTLEPPVQANYLRVADRRRNRWIRQHEGLESVLAHCEHAKSKHKAVGQRKVKAAHESMAQHAERYRREIQAKILANPDHHGAMEEYEEWH